MKRHLFIMALALAPTTVLAGEKLVATNYYVTETQTWPTAEKAGYWMVNFQGVSEVSQGPLDTLAIECNGAGFWSAGGLSGNGICVHGSGDDTFVLRWDVKKGSKVNSWRILSGKG